METLNIFEIISRETHGGCRRPHLKYQPSPSALVGSRQRLEYEDARIDEAVHVFLFLAFMSTWRLFSFPTRENSRTPTAQPSSTSLGLSSVHGTLERDGPARKVLNKGCRCVDRCAQLQGVRP